MSFLVFEPTDPCVVDGTYDVYGYKPAEQARLAKQRARVEGDSDMAKFPKKPEKKKAAKGPAKQERPRKAKAAAAPKSDKPKAKRGRPRRPVDQPLPGMEDARIGELEAVAESYADIRDRRMELTQEEAELKATAIKVLHKYNKLIYKRNGIEIRLVVGDEGVKVKVRKESDEDEAPKRRRKVAQEAPEAVQDDPGDEIDDRGEDLAVHDETAF